MMNMTATGLVMKPCVPKAKTHPKEPSLLCHSINMLNVVTCTWLQGGILV